MIKTIEKRNDGIDILMMKNEKLEVVVSNYGCTIIKILMKDKYGHKDDVVLGYDSIEEYQQQSGYLGALVGRVANRIKGGSFTLQDQKYTLAINNGPNHLHGGIKGFSYQIFDYTIEDESTIIFNYLSKDGEEGYPGNLDFKAVYQLLDETVSISYQATSDKDTLINITNHSYFNLSGKKENIKNHMLQVKANQYACIDADGLPTGEYKKLEKTAFDFTRLIPIGNHMHMEDEQLRIGNGYDHPFIFNDTKNQVYLFHPESGRQLTVSTSLPGAQIYTANYLDRRIGKYQQQYDAQEAICIETQNLPDAIHLEENPSTILKKGEVYDAVTTYTFEVIK